MCNFWTVQSNNIKSVGESGDPYMIHMLLKKYLLKFLPNFNYHKILCSYNHATVPYTLIAL